MGDSVREFDQCCAHKFGEKTNCRTNPNIFLQQNQLLAFFTTALDRMPSDNHTIIFRANKTPAGQHKRGFNASRIE